MRKMSLLFASVMLVCTSSFAQGFNSLAKLGANINEVSYLLNYTLTDPEEGTVMYTYSDTDMAFAGVEIKEYIIIAKNDIVIKSGFVVEPKYNETVAHFIVDALGLPVIYNDVYFWDKERLRISFNPNQTIGLVLISIIN